MPNLTAGLEAFLNENPTLASGIIGALSGGAMGSAFSDYGQEGRGAVQGGLLGSLVGAAGGKLSHSAIKRMPAPAAALTTGAVAGGTIGGLAGRRSVKPWIIHHLANGSDEAKEASVSEPKKDELEKQAAMEKEAADRLLAFDYGMNLLMKQGCDQLGVPAGISREELVKRANTNGAAVTTENLAEAAAAWLSDQLQEVK